MFCHHTVYQSEQKSFINVRAEAVTLMNGGGIKYKVESRMTLETKAFSTLGKGFSLRRHLEDAWSWERRQNGSVNIRGEARSNFLQAGEAEAKGLEKRGHTYYIMPVL